jgi:hypothetical protein
MTRKDYILLAEALAKAQPEDVHCTVAGSAIRHGQHMRDCKAVADALCVAPGFDRARFLKACGVQS